MKKKTVCDLGALIDEYYAARELRLELDRKSKKMAEDEAGLKKALMQALHEAKLEGAKGQLATAAFRRTIVAQVTDEDALLEWGKKKANRHAIKVSVVGEAFRAIIAEGQAVPGVEGFTKEDISLSKAGA